jgi:uridine kinase
MHRSQAHVVAIAGPSGAGKTTIARRVAERVPGGGIVVGLDAYYRDHRGIPDDEIDVDVPDAIEDALVVEQLRALTAGQSVRQPIYDYATHARVAETRVVSPAPFIIVEGLYALYWPDVLSLVRTPIFLSLDHAECLRRRVDRDAVERGRSPDAVAQHYERSVRPMYDRHVHPTRHNAASIIDATLAIDAVAERVLAVVLQK